MIVFPLKSNSIEITKPAYISFVSISKSSTIKLYIFLPEGLPLPGQLKNKYLFKQKIRHAIKVHSWTKDSLNVDLFATGGSEAVIRADECWEP